MLLERGVPVDELLADRLRGGGEAAFTAARALECSGAPHDEALAPELTALWQKVAEACPLTKGLYPL